MTSLFETSLSYERIVHGPIATSDDRPDPNENMPAMRARVPEHLHRGVFSTGVIVMTGGTEFVLDFVQNLGRPHQIVARVVIPHVVMPQFADALGKNIDLYKQRFGPLPNPMIPGQTPIQNTPAEREPPSAAIQSESQIVGGFVDSDNPAPSGSQDIPRETASPVSKTPFASGMVPGSLASSGRGQEKPFPVGPITSAGTERPTRQSTCYASSYTSRSATSTAKATNGSRNLRRF